MLKMSTFKFTTGGPVHDAQDRHKVNEERVKRSG